MLYHTDYGYEIEASIGILKQGEIAEQNLTAIASLRIFHLLTTICVSLLSEFPNELVK